MPRDFQDYKKLLDDLNELRGGAKDDISSQSEFLAEQNNPELFAEQPVEETVQAPVQVESEEEAPEAPEVPQAPVRKMSDLETILQEYKDAKSKADWAKAIMGVSNVLASTQGQQQIDIPDFGAGIDKTYAEAVKKLETQKKKEPKLKLIETINDKGQRVRKFVPIEAGAEYGVPSKSTTSEMTPYQKAQIDLAKKRLALTGKKEPKLRLIETIGEDGKRVRKFVPVEAGAEYGVPEDKLSTSSDPNSDESKRYRELVRQTMPTLEIPDNASKDDLKGLMTNIVGMQRITEYYNPKIENENRRIGDLQQERFKKWKEKHEKDLIDRIDKFNKDKSVEKAKTMITQSMIVNDILQSKNPIGDNTVSTFLARASGEVGALSEADKAPFGGSKALSSRLSQIRSDYMSGKLTNENRNYLTDLVKTFQNSSSRILEKKADSIASQFGGIDFPKEILKNRFLATPIDSPQAEAEDVYGKVESERFSPAKGKSEVKSALEQYNKQNLSKSPAPTPAPTPEAVDTIKNATLEDILKMK